MTSLNQAMVLGFVGRDAELRTLDSGVKVANFTLATSKKWKDKNTGENREATQWHRIVVWGQSASFCSTHVLKGAQVLVCGAIETRTWTDQNGNDRTMTEIVVRGYDTYVRMIRWAPDKETSTGHQGRSRLDDADDYSEIVDKHAADPLDDEIPF